MPRKVFNKYGLLRVWAGSHAVNQCEQHVHYIYYAGVERFSGQRRFDCEPCSVPSARHTSRTWCLCASDTLPTFARMHAVMCWPPCGKNHARKRSQSNCRCSIWWWWWWLLPVSILANGRRPEYRCVWLSGKLQSFSGLSKWIFSDTRIVSEILLMNFPDYERMTWASIFGDVPFGCVQLHSFLEPNYLCEK